MPNTFFDNPPVLQGDERTQLQQLYNYLGIMSAKLNEAMTEVETQSAGAQVTAVSQTTQTTGGGSGKTGGSSETTGDYFDTLRSMITKTAKLVRNEMEQISLELNHKVEEQSTEFGQLVEDTKQEVIGTAEGFVQQFERSSTITTLQDGKQKADTYMRKTSSYIFSGILGQKQDPDHPGQMMDVTGIAIGEEITNYDEYGNPSLNQKGKCATFTMDELAFWRGEAKLAWFDSERFYINNGEIRNNLKIGNFTWRAMADGSMTLVRV